MTVTLTRPGVIPTASGVQLHPGSWWIWGLSLAAAANRTTNPLLLALTLAVVGYVVVTCRSNEPWAKGFGSFARLGLIVVLVRTGFHILLGGADGPTVLFTLPQVPLPGWAAGVRLGGPVSAEGLLASVYDGARLATLLCCVGAAVVLANPRRLLASLPGALYEVGVAVVVGMSLAPELITSVGRVRRACELRGGTGSGRGIAGRLRGWGRLALPVLADATDRALSLAASMDARGYGRTTDVPRRSRLITGALVLIGLGGICLGVFGLLDQQSAPVQSIPALAVGVLACVGGLALGSRRVTRTRFARAPWCRRDAVVILGGLAALLGSLAGSADALNPSTYPIVLPSLVVLPFVGLLLALAPAVLPGHR